MDAKPKRKNTPDTNTIEFVTALSVDECVERLKDAPSRTLERRLSARVDGTRFVVDAEVSVWNQGGMVTELRGTLTPLPDNRTRVRATQVHQYPMSQEAYQRLTVMAVAGIGLFVFLYAKTDGATPLGVLFGLILLPVSYWLILFLAELEKNSIAHKFPDLKPWLRKHVYESGPTRSVLDEEGAVGRQTETQKHAG